MWPEMYKRFIDDGFDVIKSINKEFSKWHFKFHSLRENIFIDEWHFRNKVAFIKVKQNQKPLYVYSVQKSSPQTCY